MFVIDLYIRATSRGKVTDFYPVILGTLSTPDL